MKIARNCLLALAMVCVSAPCAGQDDVVDGNVVRIAAKVLLTEHLRQGIDQKQLSVTWAEQFMAALDPYRMHFLTSDAAEFMENADQILSRAQEENVDFALLVAQRFRSRLEANAALISKLLDEQHDFTIDEAVTIKHMDYAATKQESDERWRLRIKYELLMENPDEPNAESSRTFLRGRYTRIATHYQSLTHSKILSIYIDGLARSLDARSTYRYSGYPGSFYDSASRGYKLGLRLVYRQGDLWILPLHSPALGIDPLAGCRIVAVRVRGKDPIHLSGLTDGAALHPVISPIAELGRAETIVLDIDNPRSGRRATVTCARWVLSR